ncbi:MAG TPA: FAD-dependent oxidoreductase [Candidatus Kapabacteria bacterium]|nr:FAD-dependent oxidoreductase [Candidatus Kapabacteria bacterium]
MERRRIVILGTNVAGYTAAIELSTLVAGSHDVIVVANTHSFLFLPSLAGFPFGGCNEEDIMFDVRSSYAHHSIRFIEADITHLDLDAQKIFTRTTDPIAYDYVLITTGALADCDYIAGFREHGNTILGICAATRTRDAWQQFLTDPGPVVVGVAQESACYGAAYEFLFNMRRNLMKRGLSGVVPLAFVTAEPSPAHFGIGGFHNTEKMCRWMLEHYHIDASFSTSIRAVEPDAVVLGTGERLRSRLTMIMPRYIGVDAVRNTSGLAGDLGLIDVDGRYRHPRHHNVYAAGAAVNIRQLVSTPVPCGVSKTGYLSEQMAHVAALNILADIEGSPAIDHSHDDLIAMCRMEGGTLDFAGREADKSHPLWYDFSMPGPEAQWAMDTLWKYFPVAEKSAAA